ncbi:ACP S-malonyltransferase [Pseudanabaena sp. FACHB-1277]|uniref:ACP S-malonyltransferase n=1 Tax=Pseudanabaena cinerea FACHB-1277 TaxID=2949581 RepID=A0A926Z8F1_9CYAN|nr:ACP S-malonyltransferase [Pseudanabaena cinerea FACHB-1277]
MIFLVDHNIEGHALLLAGRLTNQGRLDLLPIRFALLEDVGLPVNSSDRVVWRFAQANQMLLLTANRRMKGKDSLEEVLQEGNTSTSLPVVTVGDAKRILTDSNYRYLCLNRLLETVLYLDNYLGTRRVFIP